MPVQTWPAVDIVTATLTMMRILLEVLHAPYTPCHISQPFEDFDLASVHGQEAIELSESVMATAAVTHLGGTDDVTLSFHDLLDALGSRPNEDSIHHRSAPLTHTILSLLTIT